jgi:endonuclease G
VSIVAVEAKGVDTSTFYSEKQLSQSFDACVDLFPKSDVRVVIDNFDSDKWKVSQLCSNQFAVLYSKKSKTPLVVVERLNKNIITDAKGGERTDFFYADPRLKKEDRAELSDYKGSGLDRGHQAPAGNSANADAMAQTFALSNMIPQDHVNNTKVWNKLESDTRKYIARADGNVFVYTGGLFMDSNIKIIGDSKVWIPSHIFKLVYDEKENRAWAFVLPNTSDAELSKPMSYEEFVNLTKLNFLNKEWIH